MRDKLISLIAGKIIEELLQLVKVDEIKFYVDKTIDILEIRIKSTETKMDDALIIPILKLIRETLNIPDNDPK